MCNLTKKEMYQDFYKRDTKKGIRPFFLDLQTLTYWPFEFIKLDRPRKGDGEFF